MSVVAADGLLPPSDLVKRTGNTGFSENAFDIILTNPPFGASVQDGIESNFPQHFRTRETADLFLALIVRLLKKDGRAAVGMAVRDVHLRQLGDDRAAILVRQIGVEHLVVAVLVPQRQRQHDARQGQRADGERGLGLPRDLAMSGEK